MVGGPLWVTHQVVRSFEVIFRTEFVVPKVNSKKFPYTPAGKAAAAKEAAATGKPVTAGTPANPATKGSARGIEKKAAGMAKRAANKPTLTGRALAATKKSAVRPVKAKAKKSAGPSIGSGKKGMYY